MRHIESNTQIACVKWFRLRYPAYARLLFAVPNGGARNAVTGAIMKAEGVVAGVADLILLIPAGDYHGLCIEMKTKTGQQSQSQKTWERDVIMHDYRYAVVRSFEEFQKVVTEYLEKRKTKGRKIVVKLL